MQTVRAISSVDLSAPQYPSPADEGYHLLIDRLTGALIVHVRDGVSLDGADAEGDALTVNPIVMGGKDSNGDVRALAVSTDGRMLVNLDNATIVGGNIFVELDSSTDSVEVLQATHDNLNLNANLQVGDADVGGGNPVPISASSLPLPAGASTSAKQDDVIALLTSLPVDVSANHPLGRPGTVDSFGHLVTGQVNNQVDVQFYRDTPTNLLTVTTANGGSATSASGMATFAATAAANSRAKGVSKTTTVYTAGAEVYCIFTAAFTGSGGGTSYQRIGIYNDYTNGFILGYEGSSFGATLLKGAAASTTAKASFSEDDLTGGAGSLFTRNGVAEAIDLTKLNVWRIRFGWVGSAPIHFDVLAPDGHWVNFHSILQPNLAALPSINTADLYVTCDVNSGNSGQAINVLSNCWAAGTTQALVQLNGTRALVDADYAQLTRSVITGESSAGGGAYVNVKVNPSGTIEANVNQGDHDDLNCNANIQVGNTDVGASNPVPTSDSGPTWTDSRANISSADLTSAADLTTAPTAGQKIVVTDLVVSADTAMRVDFIEETSGTILFSAFLPDNGTVPFTTRGKFKLDTADKKLRAQASAAGNIRIFCLYHSEA